MKNIFKKLAFWKRPARPYIDEPEKLTACTFTKQPEKPAKIKADRYRQGNARRRKRKMVRLARKITRGNKHAKSALRRVTK